MSDDNEAEVETQEQEDLSCREMLEHLEGEIAELTIARDVLRRLMGLPTHPEPEPEQESEEEEPEEEQPAARPTLRVKPSTNGEPRKARVSFREYLRPMLQLLAKESLGTQEIKKRLGITSGSTVSKLINTPYVRKTGITPQSPWTLTDEGRKALESETDL